MKFCCLLKWHFPGNALCSGRQIDQKLLFWLEHIRTNRFVHILIRWNAEAPWQVIVSQHLGILRLGSRRAFRTMNHLVELPLNFPGSCFATLPPSFVIEVETFSCDIFLFTIFRNSICQDEFNLENMLFTSGNWACGVIHVRSGWGITNRESVKLALIAFMCFLTKIYKHTTEYSQQQHACKW